MSTERFEIGQIVGAFGIRGQVKVNPTTAFGSRFAKGNKIFVDGKEFVIEAVQWHKGRPLLTLPGVQTMSQAEALQWKYLEAEGAPELDEDEFLIDDLLGLKVVTDKGLELGEVDDVESYPAHEVLVVGQVRIPLIKEFVKDIDFDNEIMTVSLIYGMLPGEDD
jgi:16S rRNA processing protein RimM